MDTTASVDQQSGSESDSPHRSSMFVNGTSLGSTVPFPEIHNQSEDQQFEETSDMSETAHHARRSALGRAMEVMNAMERGSEATRPNVMYADVDQHQLHMEQANAKQELGSLHNQRYHAEHQHIDHKRVIRQQEIDKAILTKKQDTMTQHVTAAGDTIENLRKSKKNLLDKIASLEKHIVAAEDTEKVHVQNRELQTHQAELLLELQQCQQELQKTQYTVEVQKKDLFALVPVSRAVKEENDQQKEQVYALQQHVIKQEDENENLRETFEDQVGVMREEIVTQRKESQESKFSVLSVSNEIDVEAIQSVSVYYSNQNNRQDVSACTGECSIDKMQSLQDRISELEVQKSDLAHLQRQEQDRGKQSLGAEKKSQTLQRQLQEQERHLQDVLESHKGDLDIVHNSLLSLVKQQRGSELVWKKGMEAVLTAVHTNDTDIHVNNITNSGVINEVDFHYILRILDSKLGNIVTQQVPIPEKETTQPWIQHLQQEMEVVFQKCSSLRTGLRVTVSGIDHQQLQSDGYSQELSFEQGVNTLVPLLQQLLQYLQTCDPTNQLVSIIRAVVCEILCTLVGMYQINSTNINNNDNIDNNDNISNLDNIANRNSHDNALLLNRITLLQAKLTTSESLKHTFEETRLAYDLLCEHIRQSNTLLQSKEEDITILSTSLLQNEKKMKQQEELNLQLRTSMNVGSSCQKCQHDKMYKVEEKDAMVLLKSEVKGLNEMLTNQQCERSTWQEQVKKQKDELSKLHQSSRGYRELNGVYSAKISTQESELHEKVAKMTTMKQHLKLKEGKLTALQQELSQSTNIVTVPVDTSELETRIKTQTQANNRKSTSLGVMKEKLANLQSKLETSESQRQEKEQQLVIQSEKCKTLQASIGSLEMQLSHVKQTLATSLGGGDGTLRGAQGDQDSTITQLRADLEKEKKKSRTMEQEVRLLSSRSPLALKVQAQRSNMHGSRVTEQKMLAVQHRMLRVSTMYNVVYSALIAALQEWVYKHCNQAYSNASRKAMVTWGKQEQEQIEIYNSVYLVEYVLTRLTRAAELALHTRTTDDDIDEYIRWFGGNQQPVQLKPANENHALLWYVKTANCRQIEELLLEISGASTDTHIQCQYMWFLCQVQPEIDLATSLMKPYTCVEVDSLISCNCSYLPLHSDIPTIPVESMHGILVGANVDAPLSGVDILAQSMVHKTQWRISSIQSLQKILSSMDVFAAVKAEKQGQTDLLDQLLKCQKFSQESITDLNQLEHVIGAYTSDTAGAVSVEYDGQLLVEHLLPCNGLRVLEDGIYSLHGDTWVYVADTGVLKSILHLQDWKHCVAQLLQGDQLDLFENAHIHVDDSVNQCISDIYEQGRQMKYLHLLYILEKLHSIYLVGKADRMQKDKEQQILDLEMQHLDIQRAWKSQEARYRHACAKQHNIIQSCGTCISKEQLRLQKNEQMLVDDCEHVWSSESNCVCSDCLEYKNVTLKMMQTDIAYNDVDMNNQDTTSMRKTYTHEEKKQQQQEKREVEDQVVQQNSFMSYKSPSKVENSNNNNNNSITRIEPSEEDSLLFELNPTLGEVSVQLDVTHSRSRYHEMYNDMLVPVLQPRDADSDTDAIPEQVPEQHVVYTKPIRQTPNQPGFALKLSLPRGQK